MAKVWDPKDPDEELDSSIDWLGTASEPGRLYGTGDTIVSSAWTVPTGITKTDESHTTTKTTIWLSGGTDGESYFLVNQVVTTQGRTLDQTVKLPIRSK